jgi:hypothetical protein
MGKSKEDQAYFKAFFDYTIRIVALIIAVLLICNANNCIVNNLSLFWGIVLASFSLIFFAIAVGYKTIYLKILEFILGLKK